MNALSPAKVSRASVIDPLEKHLEVIVETDQLSLAIGKKGQNVRLASKLSGWKIDIKSEEEKRAEIEDQMAQMAARTPLSELPKLTSSVIQKLADSGITSIEELADTPIAELTNIKGVGPKSAEKIIASVKDFYLQASESAEVSADSAEVVTSKEESAPSEALADEGVSDGLAPSEKIDESSELTTSGSTEESPEVKKEEG
jgi:transcription termination/antitermination protein NusA